MSLGGERKIYIYTRIGPEVHWLNQDSADLQIDS